MLGASLCDRDGLWGVSGGAGCFPSHPAAGLPQSHMCVCVCVYSLCVGGLNVCKIEFETHLGSCKCGG